LQCIRGERYGFQFQCTFRGSPPRGLTQEPLQGLGKWRKIGAWKPGEPVREGCVMKRVIVISFICVLALSQHCWGCQPVAQEAAGGLIDFVLDIVTAPCNLLAVCLGLDGPTCSYPQKQQVTCVPPMPPRRPSCRPTPVKKYPRAGAPPAVTPQLPRPPEGPPAQPPRAQVPSPPLRTQGELPPPRELIPVSPPGAPGTSVPVLPPATPGQPTPTVEQPSVPRTPGKTFPAPPQEITPGVPKEAPPGVPTQLEPPTTPRTEKPGKKPKPGKERYYAPCMPIHPPCGPQIFFR